MTDELHEKILSTRVYEVAKRTTLDHLPTLSSSYQNEIYLKREDTQPVRSYKIRGAYNKIAKLSDEEKSKGIICASAGNHAQGVAYSAQKLGLKATIVMPVTTPKIKIDAVRGMGSEVVLAGDSYSDSAERCNEIMTKSGQTYIHPFDDIEVIAGQGTVGLELLEDLPEADIIFVQVGGGGLLAGVSEVFKNMRPETKLIAVEPEDSAAMKLSVEAGKPITLDKVGIFADGVAVKRVGDNSFNIIKKNVDEYITVTTDEICSAMKSIFDDSRSVLEPSGAISIAGAKKYLREKNITGKKIVTIATGANMNFQRLQFVTERILTGENEEALFAVTIPERPGALKEFCNKVIGGHSLTEFNYRRSHREDANIFVGVAIEGSKDRKAITKNLSDLEFTFIDLTDNSLAKSHVRHMVGGQAQNTKNEVLYSFEFPERPGALGEFLSQMSPNWNISLFHYRYLGADFSRVLIGFEITNGDHSEFQKFLDGLGYSYKEETQNPAYKLFL